jgi:hypothetical protein
MKSFTRRCSVRVVCISGKARHGKDTVASYMKEELEKHGRTVKIVHYADLLKFICKEYFDWDGEKDEAGRSLLQFVGTDFVRKKKPSFWVDFVGDMLELFGAKWDYILIPDVRFPNEVLGMEERGFDVTHVRVVRPGMRPLLSDSQAMHESETAMDNSHPDMAVMNDGSLKDLKKSSKNLTALILHKERR